MRIKEECELRRNTIVAVLLAVAVAAVVAVAQWQPAPKEAEAESGPGDIRITLHGQPFPVDRTPLLVDGVTLVPLRNIAEALGAQVTYDDEQKAVTLRKDASEIRLAIDSTDAVKNGRPIRLEAAPRLIGNVTMVPLRFIGESFDALVTWDGSTRTVAIDSLPSLPAVGSYENLQTLLLQSAAEETLTVRKGMSNQVSVTEQAAADGLNAKSAESPQAAAASGETSSMAAGDYSRTNTQVEGVDEADIIRTDGAYLYQVNQNRIVISQAVPADAMKVASVIDFKDQSFQVQELYVDDRHLIAIGSAHRDGGSDHMAVEAGAASVQPNVKWIRIRPVTYSAKAIVYDIADKTAPKPLREIELDGRYVTSRKIGPALYLVTSRSAYYTYRIGGPDVKVFAEKSNEVATVDPAPKVGQSGNGSEAGGEEAKNNLPFYRDTAVSDDYMPIDYPDIRYFPESIESSYMLIGGISLDRADQPMNVSAYLGSGENVYVSERNLYAAVTTRHVGKPIPHAAESEAASSSPATDRILPEPPRPERHTTIYKFRLEQGKATFVAQGEAPGAVLNPFSMDEYNGVFRIATTKGDMWRTDEGTSKNNIYTLDESMKPLGALEGLAPGERIYAVRFMGNRAYMVTFKNTDPLFALDLTDPSAPKLLGELKIPGYSDYLHPYDETHLIGFGKDTVEIPVKGDPNNPNRTAAYYQGMKLSLFDVTDVSKPVELFKEIIGARGTESELLRNHKALLFSREKNLLAFPVTVMEAGGSGGTTLENATAYGRFAFQGAYVYRVDLTDGFRLQGKITHLNEDDIRKSGNGWYGSNRNVERILYIGDTLYTLSPGMIKANDMQTLEEKGRLELK